MVRRATFSDNEEEGQDEYENERFIVDYLEEEEDGEENRRTLIRKGTGRRRRRKGKGSKFKRLKKAGHDLDMEECSRLSDDEESVRGPKLKLNEYKYATGVSSSTLQEAHEMFSDLDELLMLRKKGTAGGAGKLGEKRLQDDFDPFIILEKYMVPKDDVV